MHVESQQGIEETTVNALDNFGLSQEEVESNHGNEDSLNEMAHDVASRVLQSAVRELREAAPRVRHAFRHWRQTTHQPQGLALLFAFFFHVRSGLSHLKLARSFAGKLCEQSIPPSSLVSPRQMAVLEADTQAGSEAWIHRDRNMIKESESKCLIGCLSEVTHATGQIYNMLVLVDHMESIREVNLIAQAPGSPHSGEGSFEEMHNDAVNTPALNPFYGFLASAFKPPNGNNEAFGSRMKIGFAVLGALSRRIWDPRATYGILSKLTAAVDQFLPLSQLKKLNEATLMIEYTRQVGCIFPLLKSPVITPLRTKIVFILDANPP